MSRSRWSSPNTNVDGTNVAVHQAAAVDDVERLAGLETDHQRLRGRQRATTIEVLAQAAAADVFDDDVHRLAVVPHIGAPVVDLGDVGVLDRGALLGGEAERTLEPGAVAEVGMDDLHGHDPTFNQVKGIENGSIDTAAAARPELVATRDDPTVELCIHHHHGELHAIAARPRWAFRCETRPAAGRMRDVNRPRLDPQQRRLLVCSLVIAGGIVMIILGFMSSVTGRKALALPATIENIDPVRGAVRVPAQTEVFVDLLSGYTGVLVIDGVELRTVDPNDPERPTRPGDAGSGSTGDAAADHDLRARQRNPDVRADEGRPHRVVRSGHPHRDGHLLEDHRWVAPAVEHLHVDLLRLLRRPGCGERQSGSLPVASSWSKPASSRIGTPSSWPW